MISKNSDKYNDDDQAFLLTDPPNLFPIVQYIFHNYPLKCIQTKLGLLQENNEEEKRIIMYRIKEYLYDLG